MKNRFDWKAYANIARRAAAESCVLLRNESETLPLKQEEKIAVFGRSQFNYYKSGTGSGGMVNTAYVTDILSALKNEESLTLDEEVLEAYESWLKDHPFDTGAGWAQEPWYQEEMELPESFAVEAAKRNDAALIVIGRTSGEDKDNSETEGSWFLTQTERDLLRKVCAAFSRTIVLLNVGNIMDMKWVDEFQPSAVMYVWQGGQEGGNGVADVLMGRISPCGKLPDTIADSISDYPSSANYGNDRQNRYEEDIYVGYRYFETFSRDCVKYPFGFGLSYTDFALRIGLKAAEREILASALVINTGNHSGKEVVQIYLEKPQGKLGQPARQLVAFAKTGLLAPGQCEKPTLEIGLDKLTSYSEKEAAWILEKGTYVIWAGNSLEASAPCAVLNLDKEVVLTKTQNICPLKEGLEEMKQSSEKMNQKLEALLKVAEEEKVPIMELKAADVETRVVEYHSNAECVPAEAREFVDTLSTEKLVALASGDPGKGQGSNLGSAGISVPGSAGETNDCALEDGIPGIVLSDGPAGLRLMKHYNVYEGKIVNKPFKFSLEGGLFCEGEPADPGETRYQYCTAIPVGTLLAQTWDTALIEEVGEMIGGEMEEFSTTLWLAPGMNIHRNPLCGRNFEYYSEDPLVAGKIAAAMTNGVQKVPGCGTTIKHFACNNQEDNRMGSDSIVSERTLREIYLKGFEIAITESQPMSIMTSYNLINGVHAANNEDTCTKAARCEWGFQGMIMTDWTTTEQGEDCTASGCMRAGNDLVMPGAFSDRDNLNQELADGTLSMDDLKACISRLVNIVWQSNQFENAVPYKKVK